MARNSLVRVARLIVLQDLARLRATRFLGLSAAQSWGNIRKISDAQASVKHLSFKDKHYSAV